MIAYAWLNETYYNRKEGDGSVSSLSVSTIDLARRSHWSSATKINSTRRSRVSDSSLDPTTGSLKCRVNAITLHWPSAPDTTKYAIHRQLYLWAIGLRKYQNIQHCKECNVSLCTDNCYERFHTTWNLQDEKEAVMEECEHKLKDDKK